MLPDDDLDRWITDLRARVTLGEFLGLRPLDVGYSTVHLPAEVAVNIMLADLADLADPEGSAANDPPWRDDRLRHLRDDFRRLRDLIG